jgi:dipeptidyl aminopeptidase/acylaminoacyl peptidase
MLHGTQDQKVSIDEPRELHAKFIENGIKHVFVQYEGDNHGITKHSTHASDQIINWFDKYVKNGIAFEEDKKRFTIH